MAAPIDLNLLLPMRKTKIGVCYCLHDDHWFLKASMASWRAAGRILAFISDQAWDGSRGNTKLCEVICTEEGAEILRGSWTSEALHRAAVLEQARADGLTHVLIPDADEIIEPALLEYLVSVAKADLADRVYVHWDTYWNSPNYVIRPRERFTPLELLKVGAVDHVHLRHYEGGRALTLGPEYGLVHHLSYSGPDQRIKRKIETWGHRSEVTRGWYERIWEGWSKDRLMRNLHPTHPQAYGFAERIHPPMVLSNAVAYEEGGASSNGVKRIFKGNWPKVSVVIALHGGEEDIRACLASLEKSQDLLHEVIVVDSASPDKAAQIADSFDFVTVFRLETNQGFGQASNAGFDASSGEVIVFLNSDTVVPRIGLKLLIESLMASGTVGAAGPLTNQCGYDQRIEPTYTSIETLDLFAEDFAARPVQDELAPNDMLVGFCLAVRRSVLEEVGAFDPRFGLGTFEDNDLCYRIRRAGYRLQIASKAYIHHEGSSTMRRVVVDPRDLLERNRKIYASKWQEDLSSGFASHLPGLLAGPVRFDTAKDPERTTQAARELALQAEISLCMIVKDEERVLADCLKSAAPFFNQIVVVDTGSTDRTKQIATDAGAELHQMEWPDSFSVARNESLRHATGKWIFWMDADDTLPLSSGMALLECALTAPKEVTAFVVPVQFLDEGSGGGTRVDHIKLFRNGLGIQFEGRIHEQNLGSINSLGGKIVRSSAYVLHSGYDTSEEGQARKRVRDEKLLKMDLAERPDHPFVLFNLGMTAHYTKDHREAVKWLERSIEKAQPVESHLRKAYALLAVSKRELGLDGEALSILLRGLEVVGEDAELSFQAGLLLTEMKRYAEARKFYEAIQPDISGHFSSVDIAILGFKRFHNLGVVCSLMGDYEAAKGWWHEAIESSPAFLPSAFALFDAAVEKHDYRVANAMHKHVFNQTGPSEDWVEMGARLAETVLGEQGAEAHLRGLVERYPDAVGPRIVLARRLLQANREQQALPHLRVLEQSGSAEAAFFLGVGATRSGDLRSALAWMERSLTLNPGHDQTIRQVERLKAALNLPEQEIPQERVKVPS